MLRESCSEASGDDVKKVAIDEDMKDQVSEAWSKL